jgi:hypothetical protein
VDESISSEKVAMIFVEIKTLVAPCVGKVEVTVGAMLSTVTFTPAPGVSMFPALSVALDLML